MTRTPPAPPAADAALLWSQWLEQQREQGTAQFEQMLQMQQQWLLASAGMVEAWWAPWSPFLERGGEQLA